MKKLSKVITFSECECPHCNSHINYDQLYLRHCERGIQYDKFTYRCLHCLKEITVRVEFTYNYSLTYKESINGYL